MQHLKQKKAELQEMIIHSLGDTIIALKKWLPRQAAKFSSLLLIEAQLKELNKQKIRGVIDHGSYQLELNQIREALLGFISDLEAADFSSEAAPSQFSYKKGSVLYRIPNRMQINERSKCQVRIAFDVDTLLENIELSDEVSVKDIRISDYMTVELIEPPESEKVFTIFALHDTGQFIDRDSFTEWIFYVTPLFEGKYPLVFKVSIVEIIDNQERKRNLVLEETVEVVALANDPEEEDFRTTDYHIKLADNSISDKLENVADASEQMDVAPVSPASPSPLQEVKSRASKQRRSTIKKVSQLLGVFLILIIGTWTFSSGNQEGEGVTTEEVTQPAQTAQEETPWLYSSWNSAAVTMSVKGEAVLTQTLAQMTEDNTLEITGIYYAGEDAAPEGYENMGLARAYQFNDQFLLSRFPIDRDRVVISSRQISESPSDKSYFVAVELNFLDKASDD